MCSTVRLTKWPSTIGIRIVTTLHSSPVGWLQGQGAYPHHDSELTLCYHDVFLTWGHHHNNIVLFYHDSPITRSHFMDPTDRAIKGFYCTQNNTVCQLKYLNMFWLHSAISWSLSTWSVAVFYIHILSNFILVFWWYFTWRNAIFWLWKKICISCI